MTSGRAGTAPRLVLAILVLVYVLNLVDRLIIGILAVPIKADLGLTDTQLGLLGGFAFAIFYAVFGLPIAWLADRWSRVNIVALAVAVWSGFTALCGLAGSFWHLFLARVGVGIGEAGGIAPSYSLITDIFPPAQRARALAIFSFGSPIGSALGILFGGWVATHLDWRYAFILIGLAGLPVAILVKFAIRAPTRGGSEGSAPGEGALPPRVAEVARTLARKPSFWWLSAAGALSNLPIYGLLFWLPSFFGRSYDMDLVEVSRFYGSIVLVGGVSGMWMGGWLGDRFGSRSKAGYALIPALSLLVSAPFYAAALFAPTIELAWIMFVVPQALAFFYPGPMLTAVQSIVPPTMRATTSAAFLFIANMIGTGLGTVLLGWLSDCMTAAYGQEALRYAILYCLIFYPLAALAFAAAARRLAQDWHAAAPA